MKQFLLLASHHRVPLLPFHFGSRAVPSSYWCTGHGIMWHYTSQERKISSTETCGLSKRQERDSFPNLYVLQTNTHVHVMGSVRTHTLTWRDRESCPRYSAFSSPTIGTTKTEGRIKHHSSSNDTNPDRYSGESYQTIHQTLGDRIFIDLLSINISSTVRSALMDFSTKKRGESI